MRFIKQSLCYQSSVSAPLVVPLPGVLLYPLGVARDPGVDPRLVPLAAAVGTPGDDPAQQPDTLPALVLNRHGEWSARVSLREKRILR